MSLAPPEAAGPLRRERLRTARLYFVCDARPRGGDPEPLLRAALSGGVDIVQLREKSLPHREIEVAALTFRRLCDTYSALFIVNDDPELARACDADGVHVGQDDASAGEARELLGPDAIIGLSTHSDAQLEAAGGGARRLRQRRPGLGDADQRGAPRRRPRARLARGPQRPPSLLRDRRDRPVERRARSSKPAPTASGWCGRSATPRRRRPPPNRCGRRWPASARRRRVAERRKRKDRPSAQERMKSGYAKAEVRNQEARESLEPLADGERPMVVTIGAAISALIALSIVVSYLSGVKVNGAQPRLPQVLAPAMLMGIMAWGMWRARYWAVLGFQLVLVFLIFAAVSGIAIQASTVGQFAYYLVLLAIVGILFFFMVKAMARIQMPERK